MLRQLVSSPKRSDDRHFILFEKEVQNKFKQLSGVKMFLKESMLSKYSERSRTARTLWSAPPKEVMGAEMPSLLSAVLGARQAVALHK